MEAEGVKFVTSANVGVDVDVEQLRKDFDAIVLAEAPKARVTFRFPTRTQRRSLCNGVPAATDQARARRYRAS